MDDGSSMDWYILTANHRVRKVSLEVWEKWRKEGKVGRRVDHTSVGEMNISTVFLLASIDRDHLFETMVFGGPLSDIQVCYATWGEAVKGHKEIVAQVRSARKEAKE